MHNKKERKFTRVMKKRLAVLFLIIMLALIGLNIRITYINATEGDDYKKAVLSQQSYDSRTIPYKRGDILDRKGTVLATSEKVYNVILDCKVVNTKESYIEPTVRALQQYFDLNEEEIRTALTDEKTKSSQYQVLIKGISIEDMLAFEAYTETDDESLSDEEVAERSNVKGVWFEESYVRNYPNSTLASNVLGFSNNNNEGNTGIEGYYNSILNGVNGREFGYLNEDLELQRTIIEPDNGSSLILTLDYNVQSVVESKIAAFEESYANGPVEDLAGKAAQNIAVIVNNPSTGEILAMATSSDYDLNDPYDLSDYYTEEEEENLSDEDYSDVLNSIWKNYTISNTIEPGSTFKPIIVAAALEAGVITENDTFYCDGHETVEDRTINCVKTDGHGTLTLSQVLENSCNDAMMQIASKLGITKYTSYQDIFGLGVKTGIDLPAEEYGLTYTLSNMSNVDLAVNSFGQSFTCTMIQEIAAFSSVINGGYYYQPYIVSQILDDSGRTTKDVKSTLLKQTVSSKTSSFIRSALYQTIETGSGTGVKIDGYSIGGKTGTAEMADRDKTNYLVSFIGFAPVDDPQVCVYVVVERPNVENQANSSYAQEIAKGIFKEILPYLNIFPTGEVSEDSQSSDVQDDAENTGIEDEGAAENNGTSDDDQSNTPDDAAGDNTNVEGSDGADNSANEGSIDSVIPLPPTAD